MKIYIIEIYEKLANKTKTLSKKVCQNMPDFLCDFINSFLLNNFLSILKFCFSIFTKES